MARYSRGTKEAEVNELIDQIGHRLDAIEEMMAWLVTADRRFRKGMRVRFSAQAERKGLAARRKGGTTTGKVVAVDGYTVRVLLDGYKRAADYHHSFFDPIK